MNNSSTPHEVDEASRWMKQQSFYIESKKYGMIDWLQFKQEDSIVSDEHLENPLYIYISDY